MAITLSKDISGSRSSLIGQTYGLLAMGLVLATVCSAVEMGSTFSIWGMIAAFVGAIALMFGAMVMKDSLIGLLCYFGFVSLMGYMMGPTISHYMAMPHGSTIVMEAFGATAVTTIGLSLYAFVSGRSFNQLGGFLFAGLLAVIVAGVVNIFIGSTLMGAVIAAVSALIFCGYILFDTSRIMNGEISSPIEGAISMFLNILNLFVNLLQIFGFLSSDD